jgi:prepilin-type N-terminal cleavage/methylation domain-containing protein
MNRRARHLIVAPAASPCFAAASGFFARHKKPARRPERTGEGVPRSVRCPRATRRRGFTIVEVLATLVLLGIVLPVAMRGISLALRAASNARHMSEATGLAEQKLAELTSGDLSLAGGSGGDFGADHPGYSWTSQSTARDYGLTQIDVRVTWTAQAQERGLVVSTLYDPLASTQGSSTSVAAPAPTGGTP